MPVSADTVVNVVMDVLDVVCSVGLSTRISARERSVIRVGREQLINQSKDGCCICLQRSACCCLVAGVHVRVPVPHTHRKHSHWEPARHSIVHTFPSSFGLEAVAVQRIGYGGLAVRGIDRTGILRGTVGQSRLENPFPERYSQSQCGCLVLLSRVVRIHGGDILRSSPDRLLLMVSVEQLSVKATDFVQSNIWSMPQGKGSSCMCAISRIPASSWHIVPRLLRKSMNALDCINMLPEML